MVFWKKEIFTHDLELNVGCNLSGFPYYLHFTQIVWSALRLL